MRLEELEKFRGENGYIDIEKSGVVNSSTRETRGSSGREKDWITLSDDTNILLRTEMFKDEEEKNFCNYAELIFEELAKQVDVPCAHYDLIDYKGQKGVLSQDVRKSGEEFYTLADALNLEEYQGVGSMPIDFETIMNGIKDLMKSGEFDKSEIKELANNFYKMLILDNYCMSTDRHVENCGVIIFLDNTGKKHIKFAPLLDNECSLMLEIPEKELERIRKIPFGLDTRVELQEPLITLSDEVSTEGISKWQDMLDYLSEEPELFKFIEKCDKKLNISEAIDSVEKRIGTKIPDLARDTVENAFYSRKEAISFYFELDEKEKNSNDKELT